MKRDHVLADAVPLVSALVATPGFRHVCGGITAFVIASGSEVRRVLRRQHVSIKTRSSLVSSRSPKRPIRKQANGREACFPDFQFRQADRDDKSCQNGGRAILERRRIDA